MSHTVVLDGNYYIHRAFNVAAGKRNLQHLKKNTLTLFLSMACADIVTLKGTHALIVFDSPRSFRLDFYKEYKANRRKSDSTDVKLRDGSTVNVPMTAGSLVNDARKVVSLAGVPHAYKKGYEGDDLLGSAAASIPGPKTICARDKDMTGLVKDEDRTVIYWPQEKRFFKEADVRKLWGIEPHQMRDYLCLLGDSVDNIPGIPKMGPKTAQKLLGECGSIGKALKHPKWGPLLKENSRTLKLAKMLVTLRADVVFDLENLVIQDFNQELLQHVWEVPKSVKDLGEARKAQKMKGLFG